MKISLLPLDNKLWFGSGILTLVSYSYYSTYFSPLSALGLALLLTLEVVGMLVVGYSKLGTGLQFSWTKFIVWTLGFGLFRWLIVFFILQYSLPDYTVFHYPDRAVIFLVLTSAVLIFVGHSYAVYQRGNTAQKILAQQRATQTPKVGHISIKSDGKTIALNPSEIIYLQSRGEYVQYHTKEGAYLCYQRMKVANEELEPFGFQRIHRSYLVNLSYVKAYSSTGVTLNNGLELGLSKTYRDLFRQKMDLI